MELPPPLPGDTRNADAEHLQLLSIFHFVGAGLALLGLLFLIAHYSMFNLFFANPKMWENQKQGPSPEAFFAVFKWFYLIFAIWFIACGAMNVASGLWIRTRKRRTFSMIVAGFNCMHFPLGTVLGVFTLIVLMRDSVRKLYEA